MKIIIYGVRDDEKPYLEQWEKNNPNIKVKSESKLLDDSTVSDAKGYDGVVAYQQKPYTKSVINKLGDFGIRALSLRNVGVDNVDRDAIHANNIKVTNVPAYSPSAIAEFTVTEMMRLLRNTKKFEDKENHGNLTWAPDIGEEMNKQTVGVFATGRIGRQVIKILNGFGANVIAYDPYPNKDLQKQGIYVDTPEELYRKSDILTLHAPALKENEHMINKKTIAEMKDGIKIINCARGSLINTDDLIEGLDTGKISGAALDVYEGEVGVFNVDFPNFNSIPDSRLKNLMNRDNVLISPHIAFYTKEAVKNMVQIALSSNVDLISKGTSDNEVKL